MRTRVVFYRAEDGSVPFLEWFEDLAPRARARCRVRLERLAELGYKLRRPEADFLRDGVYELRAKHEKVNLRMLYFFHGQTAVVVSHGFSKQQAEVPEGEVALAVKRKKTFEVDPESHTHEED